MAELMEGEAQDGVRMSWNILPRDMSHCEVVPLSAIYTPIKSIPKMPVLSHPPLRCHNCHSVLNPFSRVDSKEKMWRCCFCGQYNHLPLHYDSISGESRPAEHCTTIEYQLPGELSSLPPVFIFVLDISISIIEEEMSFLKSALSEAIDLLPDNSLVGLITFENHVIVHELNPDFWTMHGLRRGYSDAWIRVPEGVRFVGNECRPMIRRSFCSNRKPPNALIVSARDCKSEFNRGLRGDTLTPTDQLPIRDIRCTDTALMVAADLLALCVPGSGGRIMAFIAGPPTEGPGAIVSLLLSEPIRSHKDLVKGSAPHYHKRAVGIYAELAKQLLDQGHVLDLFACAPDQVGVVDLKVAVQRTGGLVVLAESFGHSIFRDSLRHVFRSGDRDLGLSSNGLFEIICSKAIQVQRILGPGASLKKGGISAWSMCGLDRATSLCLIFQLAHEILDATSLQYGGFYFQFLTYYRHNTGEMRLRVTTLSRKWVAGPGSIQKLIAGFDQEAAAVVMARLVSFKMQIEAKFDPVRWLDEALIEICSRFGDYQKGNPFSFHLPPRFSIFPQLMFHLRRSQFVQVFNTSPDEMAYFRMILNRENVPNSVLMIQPSLTSYSFESVPEPAPLDVAAIAADRILLLDSYFTVVIFHGSTIAQRRNAGHHNQPQHQAFAQLLQAPRVDADAIIRERFPVPRLVICDQHESQACFLLAKLNPSHHPGGDIIFTDDVSFEVFLDYIQLLAVQ